MSDEMVLTVLARDRPGLIKSLSETIAAHGGNWIDSSMARLGGEFAGILRVSVPAGKAGALEAGLSGLSDAGIHVTVRHGETAPRSDDGRRVRLELMGVDHPGIIHGISAALSRRRHQYRRVGDAGVSRLDDGRAYVPGQCRDRPSRRRRRDELAHDARSSRQGPDGRYRNRGGLSGAGVTFLRDSYSCLRGS